MPLQLHALGVTVAEVTAHPNREAGVTLGMGEVTARGPLEMGAGDALGLASGGKGGEGWLYGL